MTLRTLRLLDHYYVLVVSLTRPEVLAVFRRLFCTEIDDLGGRRSNSPEEAEV